MSELTVQEYKDSNNKKSKYRNKKVEFDGKKFDSMKEYRRYIQLMDMQNRAEIVGLECQKVFSIVVNGQLICKYIADFVYDKYNDSRKLSQTRVVEDVKSEITRKKRDYRLKNKLMRAVHGIDIVEV